MSKAFAGGYNDTMSRILDRGVVMEKSNLRQKMSELSERAKTIKSDLKLRHRPNEHDIKLSSDNTRFMQPFQHQTITESEDR